VEDNGDSVELLGLRENGGVSWRAIWPGASTPAMGKQGKWETLSCNAVCNEAEDGI
jgi:hypothetical protein